MMTSLQIRKCEMADIPFILQLYADKDMDNGDILSTEEAGEIFKKMYSYPNYTIYVALSNGNIVGTFALLIMDNLAHKGKPSGVVEDVVVADDYRSQGIGREMMEYALNVCKDFGCYKLTLSSNIQRTRAHQFYENLGFKKHGFSFLIEC